MIPQNHPHLNIIDRHSDHDCRGEQLTCLPPPDPPSRLALICSDCSKPSNSARWPNTLPERAALARQHKLSHIGFLETLLADEVSQRESRSAALRATKAGLDPTMRFDTWTAHNDLRYDRTLLGDLTSLRFLDAGQSVSSSGPSASAKLT